jgi:hypothetical protein
VSFWDWFSKSHITIFPFLMDLGILSQGIWRIKQFAAGTFFSLVIQSKNVTYLEANSSIFCQLQTHTLCHLLILISLAASKEVHSLIANYITKTKVIKTTAAQVCKKL